MNRHRTPPSPLHPLWVWLALLGLLALTLWLAQLPLGGLNLAAGLLIGMAKALLVLGFYMQLLRHPPLLRLVATMGFALLALLIALSAADLLTRVPLPLRP